MNIKINGKIYLFNDNIRYGVLRLMQNKSEDLRALDIFLKEILIPTPTKKELFDFRESDLEKIYLMFEEFQKEKNVESKKKRSQ